MKWVWFRQLSFTLVCALVLYAFFRQTPPTLLFNHSDKVGHVAAFLLLSCSAKAAFYKLPAHWLWGTLLLLAFVLEYLQGELHPLRVFSLEDVYANIAGVVLAFCVCKLFFKPCNSRNGTLK